MDKKELRAVKKQERKEKRAEKNLKYKNIKLYYTFDIIINVLIVFMFTSVNITVTREFNFIFLLLDLLFIAIVYVLINLIKKDKGRQIVKIVLYSFFIFSAYADVTSYNWYSQTFRYYEISNFPILIRTFRLGFRVSWFAIIQMIIVIAFVVMYAKILLINKEERFKFPVEKASNKAMLCVTLLPFLFTLSSIFIVSTYDNDYYYSKEFLVKELYSNEDYISEYGYSQFIIRRLLPKVQTQTEYFEEVDDYFSTSKNKTSNEFTNLYEDYNVITIQVETLDTRLINEYTSPNMYSLLNNSIVVDDYYVTEYQQGATCNSEFMALTSLYPVASNNATNIICKDMQNNQVIHSLPRMMSSLGYKTHYYHNGTSFFYNRDKMIPNTYGFENYDFTKKGALAVTDVSDVELVNFLDNVDSDELFYVNFLTYNMHVSMIDYLEEEGTFIQENLGPIDNEFLVNYYADQMDTDAFIGALIDWLQNEGVYDNTLIYLYSDHYPYGAEGTAYDYLDLVNIEYDDVNEVHRQSLIIHDGGNTVSNYSIPSSTLDLTPTILNMVSDYTELDYKYYFGNDIFDELSLVSFSNYDIYYDNQFFGFSYTYINDIFVDLHLENYRLRKMAEFAIKIKAEEIIK